MAHVVAGRNGKLVHLFTGASNLWLKLILLNYIRYCFGVARKEETGKAKKEVYGCGERGHG